MPCLCHAHILVQESFNTQDPNIKKWYLPKKEQKWGKGTERVREVRVVAVELNFGRLTRKEREGSRILRRGSVPGHGKSTKARRQGSAWHNEHGGQCGLSRVNGGAAESREQSGPGGPRGASYIQGRALALAGPEMRSRWKVLSRGGTGRTRVPSGCWWRTGQSSQKRGGRLPQESRRERTAAVGMVRGDLITDRY